MSNETDIPEDADDIDVEGQLLEVRRRDHRYRLDAYRFLLYEGIEYTMREYMGMKPGEYRHMNGRQIAEGLKELALREFGCLARDVWSWWGIRTTRDWGEVVWGLINAGLLHKQQDDCIEDFENVYDINEALHPARALRASN